MKTFNVERQKNTVVAGVPAFEIEHCLPQLDFVTLGIQCLHIVPGPLAPCQSLFGLDQDTDSADSHRFSEAVHVNLCSIYYSLAQALGVPDMGQPDRR